MDHGLPPLRLTGAMVLRDGALRRGALGIAEGTICDGAAREIDLTGYLVLPGIIDMHGCAIERHIAPRPAAPLPLALGLESADRDISAHGVTTAWLAQGWSWEGGLRGPEFAESLLAALEAYRPRALADLRVQIRAETHMPESRARLIEAVRRFAVDYVVFNDHLPETLQMVRLAPHRLACRAERDGGKLEDFIARARAAKERSGDVPRHLNALATTFEALGVTFGSHGDPDGETRDIYHAIGARICEFPARASAAAVAHAWGNPVIMGAPEVVRGDVQSGNASALALIARGQCDVLVSDCHYPALPAAAWALADAGVLPFAQAWDMISANPARVMKLADRGALETGRRADLAIMNAATRAIEATLVQGRLTYLAGAAAARFVAARSGARMAAE